MLGRIFRLTGIELFKLSRQTLVYLMLGATLLVTVLTALFDPSLCSRTHS